VERWQLIVGLGNPGPEYAQTRHNAGYLAVEQLAARWKASWTTSRKFKSRVARLDLEGRRILLGQPETFMNLSGEAVAGLRNYYHVDWPDLLVVLDDADLPLGTLRLRPQGSSGGHHGLESIEQHLGTRQFARLRIGIGRGADGRREITDYVLSGFSRAEAQLRDEVLAHACDQIECWAREGVAQAMNRFNGSIANDEQRQPE
jgi:PTH1 family peptidyl-tRNA hydrolase